MPNPLPLRLLRDNRLLESHPRLLGCHSRRESAVAFAFAFLSVDPERDLRVAPRKLQAALLLLPLALTACKSRGFPQAPAGYREYAYVANSGSNTVSVLDLVSLRPGPTLPVGAQPIALATNPVRNEVYSLNRESATVSVLDTATNTVVATIPVHRLPTSLAVDPTGHRAFVANSGANSISILDLDKRREIAEVPTPPQPGPLKLSPDGLTLAVTYHLPGIVTLYATSPTLTPRATFPHCPGASAIAILPDSSKAFIACSDGHQVMALGLAAAPGSWPARQDPAQLTDRFLTMLDVGQHPTHLTLKPDGGEIFVSNATSGSLSEIATQTNEVGDTSMIGTHPGPGIISRDNSRLFVANAGDDTLGLYSIDDGKLVSSLHTGSSPGPLAFSADEHLLLALDTRSGDVSVIRTQSNLGPSLFTILPAGASPAAIATKVIDTHQKH